jgi:hypothetical protein
MLCSDIHFAYPALPTSRLLTLSTSFYGIDSSRVIKEKAQRIRSVAQPVRCQKCSPPFFSMAAWGHMLESKIEPNGRQ